MGLLLEAPVSIAPGKADPFLVVDSGMAVCALSRQAERLLEISETEAVNHPIGDLLVAADTERHDARLPGLLVAAVRGAVPENIIVRPRNMFGVRYWARMGPCGPPSAALIVLADAR